MDETTFQAPSLDSIQDLMMEARLMRAAVYRDLSEADEVRPWFYPSQLKDMGAVSVIRIDGIDMFPSEHQYYVLSALVNMGDGFQKDALHEISEVESIEDEYRKAMLSYKKAAAWDEACRMVRPDLGTGKHPDQCLSVVGMAARRYADKIASVRETASRIKPPWETARKYLATLPTEKPEE